MVLRIASPRCSMSHCVIRLGKNPGAMAFTAIRCRAHFTARSRVKAITAPLLALYPIASSTSASVPARPATLAILMILPPRPVSIMRRPTARLISMVPVTFVSSTLCHASSGISRTGAPQVAPALLMRMSTRPYSPSVRATDASTSSARATSQAAASARIPRSRRRAAAASSSPVLRAVSASEAPASPSASAIWKPRPREPPVTIATLPVRSNSSRTCMGHLARRSRRVSRAGPAPRWLRPPAGPPRARASGGRRGARRARGRRRTPAPCSRPPTGLRRS